jgi:hypothetical protein
MALLLNLEVAQDVHTNVMLNIKKFRCLSVIYHPHLNFAIGDITVKSIPAA